MYIVVLISLVGILALLYKCTHYATRGGVSRTDAYCGALFVDVRDTFSLTNWPLGAALSLVHIILYVVVDLAMVPFVVCSVLLLIILLVILPGTMALL